MRALTKKDMALIRGGVGSGSTSSLEANLLQAENYFLEALQNMDYDTAIMDQINDQLDDLYTDEGNAIAGLDAEGFLNDEVKVDILLATEIYYQTNYNENNVAQHYWGEAITAIEAAIAGR